MLINRIYYGLYHDIAKGKVYVLHKIFNTVYDGTSVIFHIV